MEDVSIQEACIFDAVTEMVVASFSSPLSLTRIQDCSFNCEPNGINDPGFTTISTKSSFSSSLHVGNESPFPIFTAFSFTDESIPPDFSSTIPSMPSFTFFSNRCAAVEQETDDLPRFNGIVSEVDLGYAGTKDSSICINNQIQNEERIETHEQRSRISWIQSRRNHTIGSGNEHNHMDISVIRWASCPTAPTLRLSLVF